MFNTKEAVQLVYDRLGSALDVEFELKKSDERFVRRFEGGLDVLYVGFWSYPPQFVFSVSPAVRIDEVEELFGRVYDTKVKKTVTVQTQLWRFDGPQRPTRDVPLPNSGSPYYFDFTDESSLAVAVAKLEPTLASRVQSFYNGIKCVADAHAALNVNGMDTSNSRIFHGVVASYLANLPSWPSLVQRYRAELADWPPADQEKFETAVKRLEDDG